MIALIGIWRQLARQMTGKNRVNVLDVLDYVEAMLAELQPMVSTHRLSVLAHLIEMARIEARDRTTALEMDLDKRNQSSGVAV